MRKLICKILVIFLIISSIPLASSCKDKKNNDNKRMTFYTVEGVSTAFEEIIKSYNNYCIKNLDKSYKIDVIHFDTIKELNTAMSTEIMAGHGPDIISTDQEIPFEKMINNDTFLDIDQILNCENCNINLSKYNEKVMNAGVFNGKRYILPLFYGVRALISNKDTLKKFNIPAKQGYAVTYNNIKIFKNFLSNQDGYSFLWAENDDYFYDSLEIFYEFIYSYVNFNNKTTAFNTKEFKNNLDAIYKIVNSRKNVTPSQSLNTYLYDQWYISHDFLGLTQRYSNNNKLVVHKGFLKNKKDDTAFVQMGIAVNKNTKLKDKVQEFIKYALGKEAQKRFSSGNSSHSIENITFPVQKDVYQESIGDAAKKKGRKRQRYRNKQ